MQRWDFFLVCSFTSPYSKPANLGSFEMSHHQVVISSLPSIFLPELFLNANISSPSYSFNRSSLQMFCRQMILQLTSQRPGCGRSSIICGHQQLPVMSFYSSTNRQPYAPAGMIRSLAISQQRVFLSTTRRSDECDRKVPCAPGHAWAKEPFYRYGEGRQKPRNQDAR